MNMRQRITARLDKMQEPPWYAQWALIAAVGFVVSVASWSLVAVLSWLLV